MRRDNLLAPGLILALGTLGFSACNEGGYQIEQSPDRFTVERDDLRITVREQAEIQAYQQTSVKSQLEGRDNTLIYLIPEGSVVKRGERLAELDVSEIQEKRANQAIAVAKAGATLEQARKTYEIMERELNAAKTAAESRLTIARMELEKFIGKRIENPATDGVPSVEGTNLEVIRKLEEMLATATAAEDGGVAEVRFSGLPDKVREILGEENLERDMGQMANQILQQIDQIRLARAQLTLNLDTLEHSENLEEKQFITRNELEKDKLTYESQLSKVTLSWNDIDLLINYTLVQEKIRRNQDVVNEELTLTSVVASNDARRVKEKADLDSSEAEFKLATERLENWDRQIVNAVMLAPTDGLVVYAKQGRGMSQQPVEEGMNVHRRQTLIILPDVTNMIAELKVHEADIDKVAPTQDATIRVDAFPERVFRGVVTRVSALPDSGSRWSNNDLKVYKTTVAFEGENTEGALRPGMNATVEIMIGIAEDVLAVPLPAVQRQGAIHYVWKNTPSGPVAQIVRVGRNNLTQVEVVDGLVDGETIFLAQPAGVEVPEFEQPGDPTEAVLRAGDVGQADASMRRQQQRQEVAALLQNPNEFLGRLREFLLRELPNYGTELEDETGWMRLLSDDAFQDEADMALQSDPTLFELWQIFKENGGQFAAPRGGNRGGGGPDGRRRGRGGPGRGGDGRR